MHKVFRFILLICWLSNTFAKELSLPQAFQLAKTNSILMSNQIIETDIAKQTYKQGYSNILPKFTLSSNNIFRDALDTGGVPGQFGQGRQHEAKLSFSQPIFQGGGEYFGLSILSGEVQRQKYNEQKIILDLFQTVSNWFIQTLKYEKQILNIESELKIVNNRSQFLKQRSTIGRSKKTEWISSLAQSSLLTSKKSQIMGLKDSTLLELHRIMSQKENFTLLDFSTDFKLPNENNVNPTIKLLEFDIEQTKKELWANTADFLPTVDFSGNYYLDRAGILADSKWDLSLLASWEFFSGGQHFHNRKITRLKIRSLQNILNDEKDKLRQQTESKSRQLHKNIESLVELEKALKLSRQAYQTIEKEYRSGLVNHLELLNALNEQTSILQLFDDLSYESKLLWIEIFLLNGVLPNDFN